jgi:hypothetical protein
MRFTTEGPCDIIHGKNDTLSWIFYTSHDAISSVNRCIMKCQYYYHEPAAKSKGGLNNNIIFFAF